MDTDEQAGVEKRTAAPRKPRFPIRIPPLAADGATDAAREVFAFWGEPGAWENGSATNAVNVLAQHPALADGFNKFSRYLLLESGLPVRARELVVLRIAWRCKSEYEWHFHVGYALNAGLTLDEVGAIREGPGAPNWDELDRAVLSAVDELLGESTVSDETWATLSRHFDTRQLMDLVFTAGNYVTMSWAIAAFGIQLEDWVDPIGFDLETASGRTPGGTFKPGETEDWASKNASSSSNGG